MKKSEGIHGTLFFLLVAGIFSNYLCGIGYHAVLG